MENRRIVWSRFIVLHAVFGCTVGLSNLRESYNKKGRCIMLAEAILKMTTDLELHNLIKKLCLVSESQAHFFWLARMFAPPMPIEITHRYIIPYLGASRIDRQRGTLPELIVWKCERCARLSLQKPGGIASTFQSGNSRSIELFERDYQVTLKSVICDDCKGV